ncbi:MAG: response regulator, partial [Proteobacteria bacterium]
IIGNAIKFTDRGSVTMTIRYDEPTLVFDVTDTGPGMSEDQSVGLFMPFVQADSSTTRKFGGTGLGLSIAKQLADVLGGDVILARSELDKGSTFRVTILNHPVAGAQLVDKEALTIRTTSAVTQTPADRLRGLSILLVEDSPDNQMLITRYLVKAGCTVTTANDGLEGVRMALSANFDIVLMDIQMPKLDGHGATKNLRAKGYQKPIVALTAHAMPEERIRGLKSGFTDFLTKPIQPTVLIEVLAAHAGRAAKP